MESRQLAAGCADLVDELLLEEESDEEELEELDEPEDESLDAGVDDEPPERLSVR